MRGDIDDIQPHQAELTACFPPVIKRGSTINGRTEMRPYQTGEAGSGKQGLST